MISTQNTETVAKSIVKINKGGDIKYKHLIYIYYPIISLLKIL